MADTACRQRLNAQTPNVGYSSTTIDEFEYDCFEEKDNTTPSTLPLETAHAITTKHDVDVLRDRFKWLALAIEYLLCIRFKRALLRNCTPERHRLSRCSPLIKGCASIPLLACIVFLIYFAFTIGNVAGMTDGFKSAVVIAIFAAYCGLIVSRFIIFFYLFDSDAHYPWHSTTPSNVSIDYNSDHLKNHTTCFMSNYPRFLVVCLLMMFIFDALDIITPQHAEKGVDPPYLWEINGEAWQWKGQMVLFALAIVFWYIPLNVALIVQCVICYKYNRLLKHLKKMFKDDINNDNTVKIAREYKEIHKAFEKEFNWQLKWCVQIAIVSWTVMLWIDVYDTKALWSVIEKLENRKVMIRLVLFLWGDWIRVAMTGFLYLISGCVLTEKYELMHSEITAKLEHSLFTDADEENVDSKSMMKEKKVELILFEKYVNNHAIHIKLGSLALTKTNVIILVLGLIASQFVGWLLNELNTK
mmetsp:Transcript_61466/g.97891  ORF Transcript_61466/g.97891 Transcript_61466/m.97891 type:complete len:471 (+) Transcript_61466:980-2392(+)